MRGQNLCECSYTWRQYCQKRIRIDIEKVDFEDLGNQDQNNGRNFGSENADLPFKRYYVFLLAIFEGYFVDDFLLKMFGIMLLLVMQDVKVDQEFRQNEG